MEVNDLYFFACSKSLLTVSRTGSVFDSVTSSSPVMSKNELSGKFVSSILLCIGCSGSSLSLAEGPDLLTCWTRHQSRQEGLANQQVWRARVHCCSEQYHRL